MLDNGASNRNTFNADIPANGSVSQSIDLLSSVLLGFVTPAVWTTAAIDIEVSLDNVTWFTSIYDSSSTATGVYLVPTVSSGYAIDIEVSIDGVNFFTNTYDSLGTLVGVYTTPVVSSGYAVDALALIPYNFVRFRSGTTASPVNQAAARTILVITRPFM